MKKILLTSLAIVLLTSGTDAFAGRDMHTVDNSVIKAWNAKTYEDKDTNQTGKKADHPDVIVGTQPTNFVIGNKDATACNSGKENDKIIALVAKNINDNGGEFVPMVLQCEQTKGDRHGAIIHYYSNATSGTWLCANGYASDYCKNKSRADTVTDYDYFDISKRNSLDFDTSKEITGSTKVFDSYTWIYSNDKRDGNVVLAIVDYTPSGHGAIAAPVNVRCVGTRYSTDEGYNVCTNAKTSRGFDGKFLTPYIAGNTRLVCAAGYEPNATNNDCELVADHLTGERTGVAKAVEMGTDSLYTTYTADDDVALINLQKSNPKYNSAIHSIDMYSTSPKRFGIFCRDMSTGLDPAGTFECVDCASNMRRGVCLSNNPAFGICTTCPVGKIYDADKCACVNAVALSATDLAWGHGKTSGSSGTPCWSKDDTQDYIDCVNIPKVSSTTETTNTESTSTTTTSGSTGSGATSGSTGGTGKTYPPIDDKTGGNNGGSNTDRGKGGGSTATEEIKDEIDSGKFNKTQNVVK